jgi:hypothetical protein
VPLRPWTSRPRPADELPLTESTKQRIKAWLNAYDQPRPGWPLWKAPEGLSPNDEEQAWVDEGEAIRRILEVELAEPVAYKT